MTVIRLRVLTPFVMYVASSLAPQVDDPCVDNHAACDTKHTSMLAVRSVSGSHGLAQQEPKTIREIFQETNTDKLWRHGYHRYYETQLAPYRTVDNLRLLEIGADSGISLAAWMEYFTSPGAVHGVAYRVNAGNAKEKACEIMPEQCDKLAIYSLDQSNKTALADMTMQNPEGWDIIIDDGSHYPGHQIISFQQLWPKIRAGGMYVIEDVESSYVDTGEVYQYQLSGGIDKPPPDNAVEQFKRLADVVSRKHFGQNEFTVFDGVDQDVADVVFADGIIFIHKKPADPDWDNYPKDIVYTHDHTDQSFQSYQQKLQAENMEEKLNNDPNNKMSMLSVDGHGSAEQEPKTIKEVFQETNTDKLWRHGYHRYYETQMAPYRGVDGLRLLEIGADSGISLAAWMKYFTSPGAVHGVAYRVNAGNAKEKACEMMPEQCEKLAIYSLDQSDKTALADMTMQNPEGWDIIIDDGSHYPGHQIISFQQLWPKIRPGGMYAIEDVESSYVDSGEVYQYQLSGGIDKPPPDNAVEQFKRLTDVVSRKHFGQNEFTVFDGVDQDVADVVFADGIIFIHKKPADPDWDNYPKDIVFTHDHTDQSFQSYQQKLQAQNMEEKLKNDPNNHM